MATFEEKLNNFSSIVIEDANEMRDELLNEVEEKYNAAVEQKENEFLQTAYESIQKAINDTHKSANEKILHAQMDSKKKLLLRREEIINDVIGEVTKQVTAFIDTPEYEEWLKKRVAAAIFELGKGAKTVFISSNDFVYKTALERVCEGDNVSIEGVSERDFIGGIKVFNKDRKISVDYSFKEMIEEAKKKFLQSSGLTIS